MPYLVNQPTRVENASYAFYDKYFSPDECQKIIELHKKLTPNVAIVGSAEASKVDPKKRISEVYWVEWNPELNWLFTKINDAVCGANNKWFNLHLSAMAEPFQLTCYKGLKKSKGHYDWHEDHAFTSGVFSHRKLSISVLLNDGFVGGQFEFLHTGEVKELTMGSLVIFPSIKTHRIVPVTKGTRWSLVLWVSGPPWC
jgi:PKHD-type hydroxylase